MVSKKQQHQLKQELNMKSGRICLVLRDVSTTETEADKRNISKDHVTSSGRCADDVNVLDAIETCHGVRPLLLSHRFIDRRPEISGKHTQLGTAFYSVNLA